MCACVPCPVVLVLSHVWKWSHFLLTTSSSARYDRGTRQEWGMFVHVWVVVLCVYLECMHGVCLNWTCWCCCCCCLAWRWLLLLSCTDIHGCVLNKMLGESNRKLKGGVNVPLFPSLTVSLCVEYLFIPVCVWAFVLVCTRLSVPVCLCVGVCLYMCRCLSGGYIFTCICSY